MRVKADISFEVEGYKTNTEYICDSIREVINLMDRFKADPDIDNLSYRLFTLNPITEKWEEERRTKE